MDLASQVGEIPYVGSHYKNRLEKLGIKTVEDLLNHVPSRYLDFSLTSKISQVRLGEVVSIKGEIVSLKNQYTKSGRKMQIGSLKDSTGKITAVWFNQPFLIRALYPGTHVALAGKVDFFGKTVALISPEYEIIKESGVLLHTQGIIPIYPETQGVSSKWLRARIKSLLESTIFDEYLPEGILQKLQLPKIREAYRFVHSPRIFEEAASGKKRLAFDELLFLQLRNVSRKLTWKKNKAAYQLSVNGSQVFQFISSLPFELTSSQERSVDEILEDFARDYPMNRLLEGDVGSGKTVVAAIAAFVAFANGYQSVFMAPTQILAQQHFNTLNSLLQPFKVRISLLTSDIKKSDLGRTDVFVGTHALIHNKLDFDKVALVVIDEQHRFGVEQRAHLIKKSGKGGSAPHVLTMTATPIPRTVALTFYGDLDLSTLDELPAGRQKITTWIVPPTKREGAYEWMKSQISKLKCQIFVVCPLIEESQVETMQQVKAAKGEYENLKKIFKTLKVGLLHGRQSAKQKNEVLDKFRAGQIDILVATPVVEVGIDIPNATIMLIEASERFGLAALHQLRGRVGRGKKKSYCLLFSESKSEKVLTRLEAMTKDATGFELAELDLKMRGPGEIFGTRQHGFPELKIASWEDIDLIRKTKETAGLIFKNLKDYPLLSEKLQMTQV